MRTHFDLQFGGPFVWDIDGERFSFRNTEAFAVIGNTDADIHDEVRRTADGRYCRLTVVSADTDMYNEHGVHRGWYAAHFVSVEDAERHREAWRVLRPQPDNPGASYRPRRAPAG